MDPPLIFFFNLEQKAGQEKQMYALKDNNGHNTLDPVVMRRLAVDFILIFMLLRTQMNSVEANCCKIFLL